MNMNAAQKPTILFVDDEPNVTSALKRALRAEPYELLSANSAEEALGVLEHRAIDVVVSDERMPGMPGSVFLAGIRAVYPGTIRIILSGQASLEAAVCAINEGQVHRFFLKPCNPTDLMVTIRQLLAHKRLEDQSRRLLHEFQQQAAVLAELERVSPGITHIETDADGAVVVDESDNEVAIADLLAEIEQAIVSKNRQRS
jgi:two-component system probable response regulator PhcQ